MAAMNTNSQRVPSTLIDPSAWQQAMYAFLAEKERRSGSRRTVQSYSRMLQHFFGVVGTTPARVTSPGSSAGRTASASRVASPPASRSEREPRVSPASTSS